MQFVRHIYDDLPDTISIPAHLRHIKAEVIILPLASKIQPADFDMNSFFGAIPDFPERAVQEQITPRAEFA